MPATIDSRAMALIDEFGDDAHREALRRCGAAVDACDKAELNRCISVCFALERKRDIREIWAPVFLAGSPASEFQN